MQSACADINIKSIPSLLEEKALFPFGSGYVCLSSSKKKNHLQFREKK